MTPCFEPAKGERTGVTTQALVERFGPIKARAASNTYQFVEFIDGLVYESFRFGSIWLPWSRRKCRDAHRLARHMGLVLEKA